MSALHFLIQESSPAPLGLPAERYLGLALYEAPGEMLARLQELFPAEGKLPQALGEKTPLINRFFKSGVSNPVAQSLAKVLGLKDAQVRVDQLLVFRDKPAAETLEKLRWVWREPAIEELEALSLGEWQKKNAQAPHVPVRFDDSWEEKDPEAFGLEFLPEELAALHAEEKKRGRRFNRCELEILAQTWSEHCKHKIFGAEIRARDTENPVTHGLFATHIRAPALEQVASRPGRYLSLFHDNAGVIALDNEQGEETPWAIALKMETHNSPSAISPYGGASTGVVGVHRDILGTGLGAMPIANWDVLCFESPKNPGPRPEGALPPDIVRLGVIKGIEDGGNQSGIPTVQGSVVFDPGYAVKPLVFAGAVGLMPRSAVTKHPAAGLHLFCFGGAVGADGLRGAVMSSRDLRSEDFSGSAVQVANAFVQRRMTDFLLEARDRGLIDSVTDNGAGGLASSVGEMAASHGPPGGAEMDVGRLRLKYEGLHAWERVLSESQERMTVATRQPERLGALAGEWEIPFDRLGRLTDDGHLRIHLEGRLLADLDLQFLHKGCPQLKLESQWTQAQETIELKRPRYTAARSPELEDFVALLSSEHLRSREQICRRFDHEVQGRTLRKPFAGQSQRAPQDGSVLEIYENGEDPGTAFSLSHGLSPQRRNIAENVLHSFDECLRGALVAGARLETAGLLDNFCWADPIPSAKNPKAQRRLWRLVRACETLSRLCRGFELPLISGKDSMKNNSKDFECPETLVISLGASSVAREKIPCGFFARPNDVVFWLPLLGPSLRDSAWSRALGVEPEAHASLPGLWPEDASAAEEAAAVDAWVRLLRERYQKLSSVISEGLLRSARDISEGGLITTIFEMCLGRRLGFHFEALEADPRGLFAEGLGGFVLAADPHQARALQSRLPEARRLGVVLRPEQLRWNLGQNLELTRLEKIYTEPGEKGFWG